MGKITTLFSNIHSEKEEDRIFIDAILTCSNATIVNILSRYEKKIKKMIRYKQYTSLESNEIFSEGLKRLILNIKKGNFRGDSSVFTYLNKICINVCNDEIYKKRSFGTYNESAVILEEDNGIENAKYYHKLELMEKYKGRLDKKCQEIIDLRFYSKPDKCLKFNEISEILKIEVDNAKKRFQRCYKNWCELIKSDPEFRECYN